MKPLKLVVEYQSTDYTKELEARLKAAQDELAASKQRYRQLEIKYAGEMRVNFELTDILRENSIPFRPGADMRTWPD